MEGLTPTEAAPPTEPLGRVEMARGLGTPSGREETVRTRLLLPPILNEQGQSYATVNTVPDTLPVRDA